MYKDLIKNIQKEPQAAEKTEQKTFSRQEVIDMIKLSIMKKSNEYTDLEAEELEKNWKKAFANGLTILGMVHGAHYMGSGANPNKLTERQQSPTYKRIQQERAGKQIQRNPAVATSMSDKDQIEQAYKDARAEGQSIIDKHQNKDKNIDNFLKTISMNESSGGKNLNHKQMKQGIHAGDSAVGQYGLMPNTIKEMSKRMGSNHPLNVYSKMDNATIAKQIKANPDHEHKIGKFMANHLSDKFGGDENKMAYSWFQGHNLTDDHFKTSHKDYMNHDYVQKFQKNKGLTQKESKPDKLASN